MNGEAWIALGSLASVVGLTVGGVQFITKHAYEKGVTDHRIDALEATVKGMPQALAAVAAALAAMQHTTERVDKALDRLEARVFRAEP